MSLQEPGLQALNFQAIGLQALNVPEPNLKDQWQQAKKILCIRLDAIGDVLMTTPAIKALAGGRHITLLTSRSGAEVAALVPEIDQVMTYDPPWMKATSPRLNSRPELAMVETLREGNFDAAVIFTVFSQNPLPSALLCYLADIPLRLAHCHENPYQLLTNWVLDPEPSSGIRHEVRRQLDLVASVGFHITDERLSLQVPESDYQRVFDHLSRLGLNREQPWVVIHPGATALSRRYAAEGFAAVARRLVLDANCQIVFTGTEPERSLVESIQAAMAIESFSLVGALDLAEMAALLAIAPLVIANNTGPAHLAAAVGTPVVDLYALTNPQHTPWGVPNRVLFHDVPCKFCYKSLCPEGHHHCLQLVTPDEVFKAACELLAGSPSTIEPDSMATILTRPALTVSLESDCQSATWVPTAREVWR
ncbi:lipopolysaccharide heptosyltransferase II [Phormidium sp. FACHB-592]|uniref:lipopolysaccharide heptosyltransferase II n=1 Tax=Stenomitos frigidus AS-A4 TaxID=2933935 RepID=A0ABV0KE82_9CYAN|nr:lipopolysaccharide heptosyltransferase II [Phormidium sp. FACHB-592]MBD2076153.1 lipopolysaccharide heptosyltransferase II [Phormidium sp. FACHB-592]